MKISVAWLREMVATELDGAELARRLTLAGLEVEGRAPFGDFSGVIVAEVRGKRPHPNAAKLTLVDVWDGAAETQVVCGAPNVPEPGARVLWAKPGARLPSGAVLQPKEVRGVISPGMLCAEDELGFGTSHEGILVLGAGDDLKPGDDVARALGLPDEIWEVNVTPNRPDCLAHRGIAREVAALTGAELLGQNASDRRFDEPDSWRIAAVPIEIEDAEGCPRYSALAVDGVKIAPSPLKLRVRLQSLGVRAISNVVDATNLVLQEVGQPLHAFDLDKLAGPKIVVRRAREGEKTVTLDGQERTLTAGDVVICDAQAPVAVAGVMGGSTSEVSASTTRVLIESAYFSPARVRRTAKRLGLHTEASHRFERGADPDGAPAAARRCAELLVELAGARAAGPLVDVYPTPLAPRTVTLRFDRTQHLLGVDIPSEEQIRLLRALGLEDATASPRRQPASVLLAAEPRAYYGNTYQVRVPPRRPDLTREVDLIEEIARLHGYDHIPETLPRLDQAPGPSRPPLDEAARDALAGLGFDEVVTYAFVAPSLLAKLDPDGKILPQPIRIENPLREEQSAMRTTLAAGLLGACERNFSRGTTDLRLFEVGEVFLPSGKTLPDERRRAAGLIAGRRGDWLKPGALVDFFDVKGALEEWLAALGHTAEFTAGKIPWLHPGVQAQLVTEGRVLGWAGELHPDLAHALSLDPAPLLFEIDLATLGQAPAARSEELPRFPSVVRDLSFFIGEAVSARAIADAIAAARDPLCVDFRVVEDYREPGKVPPGKKGMLWSFTYRAADRTLTDAEVQAAHERLRAGLLSHLPIDPR